MQLQLTQAEIESLLSERKPLGNDWKERLRLKPKRGHKEAELTLTGSGGSEFVVIMRQSLINALDFSVILGFRPPKSTRLFRLRRYNGKHGEHSNRLEGTTFYGFHVHTATQRYQELGMDEDTFAELNSEFASLSEALLRLFEECNFDVPPEIQGVLL